jgi:hypothetical protein
MATHLKELQSLLYRLITAVSGVGEGLAAQHGLTRDGLGAIMLGDERLSAEERVDIYANMYFYRLLDVLKEDFPATLQVLGEDNFHNLVTGYLLEHPPTEPSVYFCGRNLSDYLRDHPTTANVPFAADLAMLERAMVEVFHAADAVALDAEAMRMTPPNEWPALQLRMPPATRILALAWKVVELLVAVEAKRKCEPAEHAAVKVLVWRRNGQVFYRELEAIEVRALAAASRGAKFAQMCDLVAADCPIDTVSELNRLLARWLQDGVLCLARQMPRRRAR